MTDNFRKIISIILFFIGIIVFFVSLNREIYLYWTNIDMTPQRLFVEHPMPIVTNIIGAVMMAISTEIK